MLQITMLFIMPVDMGCMGLSEDQKGLQNIARTIYENQGIISSVCHGAVGLFNITLSDGSLLIKDKTVTGFSNSEGNCC